MDGTIDNAKTATTVASRALRCNKLRIVKDSKLKFLFFTVILIIMLCLPFSLFEFKRVQGSSSSELTVWANEGGDKVTRDELRASVNPNAVLNSVWDGNSISIFGARNEVVSFNLVIEAPDSDATNVDVEISSLTGPDDASISSRSASGDGVFNFVDRNIELFYVRYLEIEGLSTDLAFAGFDYDERHIPERFRLPYNEDYEGIGDWRDRPDHNKFYPEIAVPLELASPFTLNAGTCQSIWCDIYIPKAIPAGNYSGSISVQVNGAISHEIPVTLKVCGFTLPDFPSAKTMVYISYENINDRYLSDRYPDPESDAYSQSIKLANLHFQLAHRHKISLIDGWEYDPSLETPIEDMMKPRMAFLTGDLFTSSQGYEGIGVGVGNNVFSIGTYGSWPWQDGTEADMWRNADAWVNWFDDQAFVTPTEYFLYLIDESDDFPQIEKWAQWMDNNPGPGKKLGSLATIPLPIAVSNTPSLDIPTSFVEIGITDVWEKAVDSHKAKPGTRFYMYNGQRPLSGSFAIEDDGVALRELAWGQFKKGIERWFYWESTYYNNEQGNTGETNVFQQAQTYGEYDHIDSSFGKTGWNYFNGDGVLFYPGTDTRFPEDSYGVMGPFASLRLKYWRRGIQDIDYLTLAAEIDPTRTAEIVNRIIPKALWEYGVEAPDDPTWLLTDISWSNNPDVWEAARSELADIIEGVETIIDIGSEKSSTEMTIKVSESEIDEGDTIMVSGEILPAVANVPVTLNYSDPDGLTFERTVITGLDGTYDDYYSPAKTGQWRVMASWEGDSTHNRSMSQTTSFTVYESEPEPEPEPSDGGGIPGFPLESILLGLIVGIFVLWLFQQRVQPIARATSISI